MNTNSLILTLLHLNKRGPENVWKYVSANSFDFEKCVASLANELSEYEKEIFEVELEKSEAILKRNLAKGIQAINILEKDFPEKLYNSKDKCVFLFYKGNISLLNKPSIAIIGTRKPDEEFVKKGTIATNYFATKGYVIVSGLALGCDTIAHSVCLNANGQTIAVLPSPCDNIQPSSNKWLADKILENNGLLISEYGSGATITKFNFPKRDRIQSLLSSVVLIIQASENSGTMNAVKKSLDDGKPVYAIEGNILSKVKSYVNVDSKDELSEIETWIF